MAYKYHYEFAIKEPNKKARVVVIDNIPWGPTRALREARSGQPKGTRVVPHGSQEKRAHSPIT